MTFETSRGRLSAQAHIVRQIGTVPEFEDISVSTRLLRGQIMVRVLGSGLCGTQREQIFAGARTRQHLPHLFGHEGFGEVIQTWGRQSRFKVGTRVLIHWRPSSHGLDAPPGQYWQGAKRIGAGKVVTMATVAVVPENRITALPAHIPMRLAPFLGCVFSTGWGSVFKVGNYNGDQPLIITGVGAVGMSALLFASQKAKQALIAVDPGRDLANLSTNLGATFFKELDRGLALADNVLREAEGSVELLVIETSGKKEVVEALLNWMPTNARLVLVGVPSSQEYPILNTQKLLDGLQIVGSNGGDFDPAIDLSLLIKALDSSLLLQNSALQTKNFSPGELPELIEHSRQLSSFGSMSFADL